MHNDETNPIHTNSLAQSTSPYLLQHAHNPVDWHPWSDAAFDKARAENKPIFLSVGYSTCHWCHVMAHGSFEDDDVAAVLNEHFVSIKVDREELPDIDNQYMLTTQAFYMLNGVQRGGGWPNSVWLMPDGRAFYAGTYFPKDQFISLLQNISALYRDKPDQVEHYAGVITDAVQQLSELRQREGITLDRELLDHATRDVAESYDAKHGGFGSRPKFPPHATLGLLVASHDRQPNASKLTMITHTLDAMRRGGIYDHIGGGFHRYATDENWFLPHFEKMLYDNAQLIRAYTDGYRLTNNPRYRLVVAETFDWLSREMIDASGAFYSAIDADSEGEEGRFYVWDHAEITDLLGHDDAALFNTTYGVQPGGNFYEEATGERMPTNVLYLKRDIEQDEQSRLAAMRAKLLEHRDKRVRPHLDDKVIAAWNALAIGALAYAGRHLEVPRYTEAATRAADYILRQMRDDTGRLLRTSRGGSARLPAYLDDYAYTIEALIELYAATEDRRWIDEARSLADTMIESFGDSDGGGFFYTTTEHDHRIIRNKNPNSGGNMPNPNGVAASALLSLGTHTGETRYTSAGVRTLDAFAWMMSEQPYASGELLTAAMTHLDTIQSRREQAADRNPVTVTTQMDRDRVTPGDLLSVTITLNIAAPYHVYANEPGSENVTPTRVTLEDSEGIELIGVQYPEPKTMKDPVLDKTLSVYEGQVRIVAELRVNHAEPFTLTIITQACDDRACQLATSQQARWVLEGDRFKIDEAGH